MENTSTIIIEQSLKAGEFKHDNLIHQQEFDKASKLINKQIEIAGALKQEYKHKNTSTTASYPSTIDRSHNTIAIFGGRGSGKTSFIYSLLSEFASNNRVAVLKVIDPTLVEEKGHFFLLIISLINELVEEKLCKEDCAIRSDRYINRATWEQHLKKLSQGIPSLDKIGRSYQDTSWQDAEYIMDKGLKCFQSAFHLEENFHRLVNIALDILDKDLFLIAFDDIDIDFSKGWSVLEVIRKYMTTPQIITLLSGNMNLYVKNIRKQQWMNLGKGLLINEASQECGKKEYRQTVNEIEGQYLLKILKPENRIYLNTIYTCINSHHQHILIDINAKKEDINNIYTSILNSYGIRNREKIDIYKSFLLSMSVRSQIHFILAHINGYTDDTDSISAFISRMYANNIDIDLALYSPKTLNRIIMRFLLNEKSVIESYQLLPMRDDIDQNICLMGLSILFAKKSSKDPFLLFDYLIRIGFMRNLLNIMHYADNNEIPYYELNFNQLCRYAEIFQDSLSRDIIGHSLAYTAIDTRRANTMQSIVPGCTVLSRDNRKLIKKLISTNDFAAILACMPICRISSGNQSYHIYSFHLILSAITDLIRIINVNGDIYAALKYFKLIRTYQTPSYDIAELEPQEAVSTDENVYTIENNKELFLFSIQIKQWFSTFTHKGLIIPPHLLGKISTRVYHAIKDIEESYTTSNQFVDYISILNRCVIAFYNAVLIEEFVENYQSLYEHHDIPIVNNIITLNTIQKSDIFYKNFSFLLRTLDNRNIQKIIPLTLWLMECPILLKYVDYKSEIYTMNKKGFEDVSNYLSAGLNWKTLCNNNIMSLM